MKKILSALLLAAVVLAANDAYARKPSSKPKVKNVIYLIGDGMGVAQVTALMIENKYEPINMERATAVGLVKTYSANNRVTDSAAAGTALATGTKTKNSRLGIDPDDNNLRSVLMKAQDKGYRTGIVVTVRVQHATPGAFYANVKSRSQYDLISEQLLDTGIDVFMGGGLKHFKDREDGRNLIPDLEAKGYQVYYDFENAKKATSGKVIALLADTDLPINTTERGDYVPEATAKTLDILKANGGKGFFLMVEGSQIDYAGHNNSFEDMLGEMYDFDKAVGVAFDYADRNPGTLVVVTADHETGGLSMPSNKGDFTLSESGIEYKWSTGSHTGIMVPLFAYGEGAECFSKVLDNTDIPKIIEKLLLGK